MNYPLSYQKSCDMVALSIAAFFDLLDQKEVSVIDVRNYDETPVIDGFADRRIPLDMLAEYIDELDAEALVFVCQTGDRSEQAANMATQVNPAIAAYCLEGGMEAYCRQKNVDL